MKNANTLALLFLEGLHSWKVPFYALKTEQKSQLCWHCFAAFFTHQVEAEHSLLRQS